MSLDEFRPPAIRLHRELRRQRVGAALMAAAALAVAALLLPRGDELLLIYVRSRNVDRAQDLLTDRATREASSTVSSVVAHSELYLMEGRVGEALSELERFVTAQPDNVAAWTRLARLYGDAQRPQDRLRALAEVHRLQPAPDTSRQLAMLYRWAGNDAREAAMLRALVRSAAAAPDEYVRSAGLDAARGETGPAFETLEALRTTNPDAFDYAAIELYASLAVDRAGPSRLGERVQAFPAVVREPVLLQQLSAEFRRWGRHDAALAVLDTSPNAVAPPRLLTMRARAAVGTPAARTVIDELVRRDAAVPLSDETLSAVVDLALSTRDYASIDRLFDRPRREVPSAVVVAVVGHAVSHGDREQAQRVLRRLGDDALAGSPVLALALAAERRDETRAVEWIRRIEMAEDVTPEDMVAVATVEATLGRQAAALTRLAAVVGSGHAPPWAYRQYADLAAGQGAQIEALTILGDVAVHEAEARRAWVGLAAHAGRTDLIDAWVASTAVSRANADALRDAYSLLLDRGLQDGSLRAAERLVAVRGTADDQMLLGTALLAADRPVDALAALRRADPARPQVRTTFEAALARALFAGEDLAGEVRAVFTPRLRASRIDADHRALLVEGLLVAGERASLASEVTQLGSRDLDRWLSPLVETARASGDTAPAIALVSAAIPATSVDSERGERLLRALMDLDAPNEVLLPRLRALALTRRDSWAFVYDERLAQESRDDERTALWSAIGRSPASSMAERRAAASRLIELGANDLAGAVLQDLAAAAGPEDPDTLQLLWTWGPRPDATRLQWLLSRLEAAPSSEQAAWMTHLLNAGGAALVVNAVPRPPADAGAGYLRAWVDAHRGAPEPTGLRYALETVLSSAHPEIETLRHAGATALSEGLFDVAARAFRAVLQELPADQAALRWAGTVAFYRGEAADAFTHLEAYAKQGGREAEPLFQLGELWLARRDPEQARRLYTQALDAVEAAAPADRNPVLRANVLVRLDDRVRAAAAFDDVLAVDPANRHARADYASALLRWGRDDEAGRLLKDRPADPDARDRDGSGDRRLDLLRAQWLNNAGRFGAALTQLESLTDRHPADPDVLMAQAAFDLGRGQLADADRYLQAARAIAPTRTDIAEAVDTAARERDPRASIATEVRAIGPWTTTSRIVSVGTGPRRRASMSLTVEQQTVSAPQVLRADGSVTPLATDLTRVEGTATVFAVGRTEVRAGAFGAAGGLGGGGTFIHRDLRGAWTVTAEVSRPFWDFVESAADGGRKDRWGLQREWRFRPDTAAWVVADWNRYRTASSSRAVSSALTLGFIRTVRTASPTVTLQYGVDSERVRHTTRVTTAEGLTFSPIPLTSREVHVMGLVSRANVGRFGELDASGGYTLDRFGGRGSFLTTRLTPRPSARIGLDLWAERRLYQILTTQQAVRLGARGVVRF